MPVQGTYFFSLSCQVFRFTLPTYSPVRLAPILFQFLLKELFEFYDKMQF